MWRRCRCWCWCWCWRWSDHILPLRLPTSDPGVNNGPESVPSPSSIRSTYLTKTDTYVILSVKNINTRELKVAGFLPGTYEASFGGPDVCTVMQHAACSKPRPRSSCLPASDLPTHQQHMLPRVAAPVTWSGQTWNAFKIVVYEVYKKLQSYPFCEALLALGSVEVDCFAPGDELHQHDAKWVDVGFFCYLTTLSILRRQVPSWGITCIQSVYKFMNKHHYWLSIAWKERVFYPNVPITLVSTPVSPSGCHLARPKSPTYAGKD